MMLVNVMISFIMSIGFVYSGVLYTLKGKIYTGQRYFGPVWVQWNVDRAHCVTLFLNVFVVRKIQTGGGMWDYKTRDKWVYGYPFKLGNGYIRLYKHKKVKYSIVKQVLKEYQAGCAPVFEID